MQISASTLLASQQASQQIGQVHAKPAAGFTRAGEKASSGFQPLPLKQAATVETPSPNFLAPAAKGPQKLGSTIDIKI